MLREARGGFIGPLAADNVRLGRALLLNDGHRLRGLRRAIFLGRLPHDPAGVIVRSVFPAGSAGLARVPGYNSASLTQNIEVLLTGYAKGQFRQYFELIR